MVRLPGKTDADRSYMFLKLLYYLPHSSQFVGNRDTSYRPVQEAWVF